MMHALSKFWNDFYWYILHIWITIEKTYLCPSFLFTFYTTLSKTCDLAIIDNTTYKSSCKFYPYNSTKPFVAHTIDKHYIHLPQLISISISCPSQPTKVIELQGSFTIDTQCTVISPQLHILPSRRIKTNLNTSSPTPNIVKIKSYILSNPAGNVDDDKESERVKTQMDFVDVGFQDEELDVLLTLDDQVPKQHFIITSIVIAVTIVGILVGAVTYIYKFHNNLDTLRKLKNLIIAEDHQSETSSDVKHDVEDWSPVLQSMQSDVHRQETIILLVFLALLKYF